MSDSAVEKIVEAVLYEGYILYPYRPSSIKNKQRFTFGRVYPEIYSRAQKDMEPWVMQTECLARIRDESASVEVTVRFLHPMWREVAVVEHAPSRAIDSEPGRLRVVSRLQVDGKLFQTWQEAVERQIESEPVTFSSVGSAPPQAQYLPFVFPSAYSVEELRNGQGELAGKLIRRQEALEGIIEIVCRPLDARMSLVTVRILNRTAMEETALDNADAVLMRTFASAHTILTIHGGEFVSMMDPPAEHQACVDACKNIGTWPVLVGDEQRGQRDTMLSSPIILYDYPKIAPESPGSFFDSTEIDELLTLRVITMTEEEKSDMRQIDEQARRVLERAETVDGAHLMKMHGTLRDLRSFDEQIFGNNVQLQGVSVAGVHIRPGDRVRIRPRAGGDVMDLALAGKIALIEAVEQDVEQRIHLALVVEDDPGRDLGLLRQPGHRFFFGVDEVEPLRSAE
ncbi:MAG: hypothetical protein JWM16_773 [Verrucomicrobiales bacterium]|nr:hypothetical protein [Verrucomicrobiales bacterium]